MISEESVDRLPDFLIIGTMKSGTSALFEWLVARDDVHRPVQKEPNFFSHDRVWAKGTRRYEGVFAGSTRDQLVGEASVSYMDPAYAGTAARRASEVLDEPRLVCVLRDPVERLRSHYRHEVQRGRERRSLLEALADPANPYVRRSRYARALEPWIDAFGLQALCAVRFEDLTGPHEDAWQRILRHLGLPLAERPTDSHNVTASKGQFTGLMRLLWKAGLTHAPAFLPPAARRIGRRALIREGTGYHQRLEESRRSVPADVVDHLADDAAALPGLLADPSLRWPSVAEPRGFC